MYNRKQSTRVRVVQRPFWFGNPGSKLRLILAGILASATLGRGQVLMLGSGPDGHVNIFNTDLAVLEAGETRKDLECTVTPNKPALGFDLRFHAGYDVALQGSEGLTSAERASCHLKGMRRRD